MSSAGHTKRFVKTSGIYFAGTVLAKLVTFLLLPVYTAYLKPAEYGQYDLVLTMIGFFAPIAFFQIWDAMYRFTFDSDTQSHRHKVFTNTFTVFLLGFIVFTFLFLAGTLLVDIDYAWLVYMYGLVFSLQYLYTFIARSHLKNTLFVVSGLLNTLTSSVVSIILIVKFDMGVDGLLVAAIAGNLLQVLLIELVVRPLKSIRLNHIDRRQQLLMLKFSIPLCVASTAYWLLSGYTKLSIASDLGTEANGLYAVSDKFSFVIVTIVSVFQFAWNEIIYLTHRNNGKSDKYSQGIRYLAIFITLGSAGLILLVKIIFPYFVARSYDAALAIIPIAILGASANALTGFLGTIFLAEKKTKHILWTTLIASVINILLLYMLLPRFGLTGAVASLTIAFISLLIIRGYIVSKHFKIKFLSIRITVSLVILLLSVILFYSTDNILTLGLATSSIGCLAIYYGKDLIRPLLQKAKT